MCVKGSVNFQKYSSVQTPLRSIFLDSLTTAVYLLLRFSPYILKIALFFISTNSIQMEEKTHMPVTVCYAFNENIHMYCFHE